MEEIDPQRYVLPGLLALLVVGAFLILVSSGGGDDEPGRPLNSAVNASTTATTSGDATSPAPLTTVGELPAETTEEFTEPSAPPPATDPSEVPGGDPLAGTPTTDTTTPAIASEPTYIKVQQGDTMTSIASATGVSRKRLIALNPGVDPESLPPGKLLKTGP